MTKRQLICWIGAFTSAIIICGIVAFVSIRRYERQTDINAQTQIERTKLEQDGKLERTRERMNWIPWYNGGQNKEE